MSCLSYVIDLVKSIFQLVTCFVQRKNWKVVGWSRDEIELQKVIQILNSHAKVWVHHGYQELLKALRDLVLPVQNSSVGVEFEEFCVTWLQLQVLEVCILRSSRMERWSSESKHEKQSTQRKYICCLCYTRHLSGVMYLGSHVVFCTHFLRYQSISPCWKCKVAKL